MPEEFKYCTKCGAKLKDGAVFCANCGTRVKAEDSDLSAAKPVTSTQADSSADQSHQQAAKPEVKPRSKRKGWFIGIGVAVAVIAVFAIVYFGNNAAPSDPVAMVKGQVTFNDLPYTYEEYFAKVMPNAQWQWEQEDDDTITVLVDGVLAETGEDTRVKIEVTRDPGTSEVSILPTQVGYDTDGFAQSYLSDIFRRAVGDKAVPDLPAIKAADADLPNECTSVQGISFRYPDGWGGFAEDGNDYSAMGDEMVTLRTDEFADGSDCFATITVSRMSAEDMVDLGETSVQAVVNQWDEQMKLMVDEFQQEKNARDAEGSQTGSDPLSLYDTVLEADWTEVDGIRAVETQSAGGGGSRYVEYTCVADDAQYKIQFCYGPVTKVTKAYYEPLFEAIIGSVQFNDEPDTENANDQIRGEIITVGIINNPPAESGYREANVSDFESVFTAENGFNTKTAYSINNDEQLRAAQQFIEDGVEYLLISAADTAGWESVLHSAKEAGVKVFLFDRMIDVPDTLYEAAVVSDMQNEGQIAVNWLLNQASPETHKVVHLQGWLGSDAQIGRSEPLQEQADAGTLSIVLQQTALWDEEEAKQIVESAISSGIDFDVIYAENDNMARGAVAALDEAGITHGKDGKVIIIGFNSEKWALQEVLRGNWNLVVQCSPFQARPIADMIRHLENGDIIENKIVILEERDFSIENITEEDVEKYGT